MNKILSLLVFFCISLSISAQHTDRFSIYGLKGKVKACEFYDEEGHPNNDDLAFDRAGRLINVRNHPLDWNYGHHKRDAQGRITSLGDKDNGIYKYTYNAANQLTRITTYYSGITTKADVVEQYSYDSEGRIVSIVSTYSDGTKSSIMYSDFTKTDSHGNWIRAKVVEINQQGEREEYTQLRRLTYFQ